LKKLVAGAKVRQFSFRMACIEFTSVKLFCVMVLSREWRFFPIAYSWWTDICQLKHVAHCLSTTI